MDVKLENSLDHTAERVALWRALHVKIDPSPHVLSDEIGEQIIGKADWMLRPDMEPSFSKPMRASIIGRSRFVEDLVLDFTKNFQEIQYVILGAGLDSFSLRHPELEKKVKIFEIDKIETQEFKTKRIKKLYHSFPTNLKMVPLDLTKSEDLAIELRNHGLDSEKLTVVSSLGLSMYLTKNANFQTLKKVLEFSDKVVLAMSSLLSLDQLENEEQKTMEFVMMRAQQSGTPFLSLFSKEELLRLATKSGFSYVEYISAQQLFEKYFLNRSDGLRAGNAEGILLAKNF